MGGQMNKYLFMFLCSFFVIGFAVADTDKNNRFFTVTFNEHLYQFDSVTGRCWILSANKDDLIFKPIIYAGIDGNLRIVPETPEELIIIQKKLLNKQIEIKQKQKTELLRKLVNKKKQLQSNIKSKKEATSIKNTADTNERGNHEF